MGTFHFVIDGFADIVQQSGALRQRDVRAKLSGHDGGKMRDLDGVIEHVLTITCAVAHTAKVTNKLMVQTVHTRVEHRLLARFADLCVHLLARLLHRLLNARRMDAAVKNQFFERDARDLAAHRIKPGENYGFRRIVNDEVDARGRFECANIAPFAADDAALHLIVGQRHDGYRRFRHMVRCAPLDG